MTYLQIQQTIETLEARREECSRGIVSLRESLESGKPDLSGVSRQYILDTLELLEADNRKTDAWIAKLRELTPTYEYQSQNMSELEIIIATHRQRKEELEACIVRLLAKLTETVDRLDKAALEHQLEELRFEKQRCELFLSKLSP